MPKGVYEHKPLGLRAARVTLNCQHCGVAFELKASQLRVRKTVKFCSQKCMGLAKRKPDRYIDLACEQCGRVFTKRIDHIQACNHHYCSRQCSGAALRVPGARWKDPAQIRQYMRDYTNKNRDKHNARARQWNIANRGKKAAQRQARRANAKAGDFTADQWESLKARYNYTCLCCGKAEPTVKLELDHIVPVTSRGKHTEDNIQPLCRFCNASKGARTIDYRPK